MNIKRIMTHYLLAPTLLFAGMSTLANANQYYVSNISPIGSDTVCNGTANAPATSAPNCAFLTITKAANTAKAGDNVSILPGTYTENVNFANSGTANAPITFTGTTSPVITSTVPITSTGVVTPIIAGNVITTGNYNTIEGLTFSAPAAAGGGVWYNGSDVYLYGTHNLINNCEITNYGALDSDQAVGITFDSGSAYNTFQNSSIVNLTGIDAMHVFGHDQKILHNYVNNINFKIGGTNHVDFIQTFGWTGSYAYNILVDSNTVTNGNMQTGNLEIDGSTGVHDWTFSNNVFANVGNSVFSGVPNTHFYNNLFYQTGTAGAAITLYQGGNYSSEGNILVNNAFINNTAIQGLYALGWQYASVPPSVITISNNFYATTTNAALQLGSSVGTNAINGGNPAFVNPAALNFNLQAGSALIGKGLNLSSSFTNDAAGNTRTTIWDIGPYAYNRTSGSVTILPPSFLTVH